MNSDITIYDVAGAAKVSVATVSRVMNKPDKVGEKTREKVLETIKKLGYKPNAIARSLASRKSTSIGIIVSDISRASVSQMIKGIIDAAKQNNYSIKLYSIDDDILEFSRVIFSEKVDGAILIDDELSTDELRQLKDLFDSANIPLVLANAFSDLDIPSVNIDFELASYQITKRLIENGRKDIYFLSTINHYGSNHLKEAGYQKAILEAGLSPHVVKTFGEVTADSTLFSDVLKSNSVDGVIAVRDSIAVSFINVAQEKGFAVPKNIDVAGLQNTKYAVLSRPALTCIDIPVYQIGMDAMKLLSHYMNGETVASNNILLLHSFVYRNSVFI